MEAVQIWPEWLDHEWQEQFENLALEVLKALGCYGAPVALEYFPKSVQWMEKPGYTRNGPTVVKISPKLLLSCALDILASKGHHVPCKEPKALAYLVDQVLAPSSWIYRLWQKSRSLGDLVESFPCLQGELFAKRMAGCLAGFSGIKIGWIQGGKLVWRRGGEKGLAELDLAPLEGKCWRSCRDYSRFSILEDDLLQVQCWPWHRVFPKGEVMLSQTQEICG